MDARVTSSSQSAAVLTTKTGEAVFAVPPNASYTVTASKTCYSASKRKPGASANVTVGNSRPADTTLYLTVTNKLLIIGEGTDYGYAGALATRYSGANTLKQVVATQFPNTLSGGGAPDNLVAYKSAL